VEEVEQTAPPPSPAAITVPPTLEGTPLKIRRR